MIFSLNKIFRKQALKKVGVKDIILSNLFLLFELLAAFIILGHSGVYAQSINEALSKAYSVNPDIDEQRAKVRVRDEDVPKAMTGMRPKASVNVYGGPQRTTIKAPAGIDQFSSRRYQQDQYSGHPFTGTFKLDQVIFDGGKTAGSVRQAFSGVLAARGELDAAEQEVLLKGATAYMDVFGDTAILRLKKNNVFVLRNQLKVTQDRYEFGEVSQTDVAQAEAALAKAQSEYAVSSGTLQKSMATYEKIIGSPPEKLVPVADLAQRLPSTKQEAIEIAIVENPLVKTSLHTVDAAEAGVKVAEAALMPNLSIGGQVIQSVDSYFGYPNTRQFGGQGLATLNVPIYQGGGEYTAIRQSKEQVGQARIHADSVRNEIRAKVVESYAQFEAASSAVKFGENAVKAAERALRGVRDEAFFGQRTTQDVLNAQQVLLEARVNLVSAQHDKTIGTYMALAAIGRLSAGDLGLDVVPYNPAMHYENVKDKWFGVSTPDGR
jgi:outer membrane protein